VAAAVLFHPPALAAAIFWSWWCGRSLRAERVLPHVQPVLLGLRRSWQSPREARVWLGEVVLGSRGLGCLWLSSAPRRIEPCVSRGVWTCCLASRRALTYAGLDLKLSLLFLSSACGSPGPSFSPSSLSLPSTATDDCYSSVHRSTLVSLLKKNAIITTPCGSCTNICCFDSTLFQRGALEGLCEHFLQAASWWESCGTVKRWESPI